MERDDLFKFTQTNFIQSTYTTVLSHLSNIRSFKSASFASTGLEKHTNWTHDETSIQWNRDTNNPLQPKLTWSPTLNQKKKKTRVNMISQELGLYNTSPLWLHPCCLHTYSFYTNALLSIVVYVGLPMVILYSMFTYTRTMLFFGVNCKIMT